MLPIISISSVPEATTKTVSERLTELYDSTLSPTLDPKDLGSLPYSFDKRDNSQEIVNILQNYPWTVTNDRTDIPFIVLKEHRNTSSTLARMSQFYGYGSQLWESTSGFVEDAASKIGQAAGIADTPSNVSANILETYEEIFPNCPTGYRYIFPYFPDMYVELNTPEWNRPNKFSQSVREGATTIGSLASRRGQNKTGDPNFHSSLELLAPAFDAITGLGTAAHHAFYPVAGIQDTPRIFTQHSLRTITIQFPLYNTLNETHWEINKKFIDVFLMQNLFAKRNFITGSPPCYYRVHAPGQYFCYAASVAEIDVKNLGNIRMLEDKKGIKCAIPDAYQVSITLNEMVMPSLNQQKAIIKEAEELVETSFK